MLALAMGLVGGGCVVCEVVGDRRLTSCGDCGGGDEGAGGGDGDLGS